MKRIDAKRKAPSSPRKTSSSYGQAFVLSRPKRATAGRWDASEDEYEPPARSRRPSTRRKAGGFPWIRAGLLAVAVWFGYQWAHEGPAGQLYTVTGVGQGQVYAVDDRGQQVAFADQALVRQALAGQLRRGDTIRK